MERRIKTLYIITIIAILAFLGMQSYWLYVRYESALKDYERILGDRVMQCVNIYNGIRASYIESADTTDSAGSCREEPISIPVFRLSQQYGDTVRTTRTATIVTYNFSMHKLLGLKPGEKVSNEQREKAIEMAKNNMDAPADSVIFDASGAKDENEAWSATRNVLTERKTPFRVEGLDSIMTREGIRANVDLIAADSMVWKPSVSYNVSVFKPDVALIIPYSQLEGKTVSIVCDINPLDVLPGMWHTLLVSLAISVLLIVCLILQFSTVLKLSRLNNMRNSFVTTMIHELKRPISTLKMCVSGLGNSKMVTDEATRSELLSETRTALDNLSAYFSKLRDITFNDVGQIPLNIQAVSLRDLFDSVTAAAPVPSGKTVMFDNQVNAAIELSADKSHLYNMLINLVENAIKYSGPSVTITAKTEKSADSVIIRISDNGNGISSGDLRHIFKRFYRGRASEGDMPGMGLGLAYVKLLVEAHGGEIAVESAQGKGSCFIIRLPQ